MEKSIIDPFILMAVWSMENSTDKDVACGLFLQESLGIRHNIKHIFMCRYRITKEKPTGAIAGVQRVLDGPIEWSYHLPHTCQLSQ